MLRSHLIVVGGLLLSACATTLLRGSPQNAEQAYAVAMEDLDDGLFPEAIAGFTDLKNKYPYSQYAALADLRIADTHFARGKFIEAIDAYRVFLKLHPSHSEAPYAMFRIAEANFEQIPEDWWFLPPSAEKDQANTRLAISAYRDLLARYPNLEHTDQGRARLAVCRKTVEAAGSAAAEITACQPVLAQQKLVVDAAARLDECRRKLADHEFYVARFYFDRRQFAAAVGRAEGLLRDYAGLGLDPAALLLSARGRLELGGAEVEAARASLQRLTEAFADSDEAADARELLRGLGNESAGIDPNRKEPGRDG